MKFFACYPNPYNVALTSSMPFDSFEDAATHLIEAVDRLEDRGLEYSFVRCVIKHGDNVVGKMKPFVGSGIRDLREKSCASSET